MATITTHHRELNVEAHPRMKSEDWYVGFVGFSKEIEYNTIERIAQR